MLLADLFYGFFWTCTISFIWFYTDSFLYYSQLFRIFNKTRREFQSYLLTEPNILFTDFLAIKASNKSNICKKFILKLLSCVLCFSFWIAVAVCLFIGNIGLTAPVYILTISFLLGIKNWL